MVGLRQAPETSSAVSCNDVHDVDYFLNEIVREVHGIGSKSKPLELLFVSWPQEHPRLLRDYEVHQVLATLGRGVQVTVIVDGCHAGHVLDRTRDHRFESIYQIYLSIYLSTYLSIYLSRVIGLGSLRGRKTT